jgi:hypothetical protein
MGIESRVTGPYSIARLKADLKPTLQCLRPCQHCYCAEHIEHGLHMHQLATEVPRYNVSLRIDGSLRCHGSGALCVHVTCLATRDTVCGVTQGLTRAA